MSGFSESGRLRAERKRDILSVPTGELKAGPNPQLAEIAKGEGMGVESAAYELLDFGDGRKLERFGEMIIDRPCPTASGRNRRHRALWKEANGRYFRHRSGEGTWQGNLPETWEIRLEFGRILLWPAPFGHVGMFPEQGDQWDWLRQSLRGDERPLRVLNLFAYTGGSTLAAVATGAEVTHVDAAKNIVRRARQNAAASGRDDAVIRWIVEDAVKFCQREVRRKRRYDAIILDPPSYGRGPKGEVWRYESDMPALLNSCGELASDEFRLLLLTCHTSGIDPGELESQVRAVAEFSRSAEHECGTMATTTAAGAVLPAGVFFRWKRNPPK